ncbi:MAG: hypothetical protein MUP85_12880 [Candidatus Lokiarchaeota archaeon]|nr:hypothetical protein [Candidatus Lokiarchaeota archaeon]
MKKLKICPKCKQPKLRPALNVSGWLSPDYFECENCGYLGSLYLEIDPNDYISENEETDI